MSDLKLKLSLLPDKPGCYLMKDKNSKIIYVGKAKNLKNRVKSYFTGAHNAKTTKLVSEIEDFDYIITASNKEAFVLEINLIKQHNPKYNIMLKDDKTYPFIALTNEVHPRLIITRVPRKKQNAKYFGPYPNVSQARMTVELLNRLFPLRKCSIIPKKECLYYHMNACLGPCINDIKTDYKEIKNKITDFLNGDIKEVVDELKEKMLEASQKLEFEKAKEYRDQIISIENTTESQKISLNDYSSADYIGVYFDDDSLSIHILMVRKGAIVCNHSMILPYFDSYIEVLENYLVQYYSCGIQPNEIYIEEILQNQDDLANILNCSILNPKRGQKREVLDMANLNAQKDLETKKHIYENKVLKRVETIEKLGEILGIDTPTYIESFDNSNLFGEYPISAMVVYKNGQAVPSLFRKYHIKTVIGPNDYESMKEVIYRRYLRLLMEEKELPNLILMDGGQIQVNACLSVLKSLNLSIPVAGIQKDDHHKATLLYYDGREIRLEKNSDVFLFLANVSQRVHDFAISFFRSQKVKGMFASMLDGISGLGEKRKEKLLKHFITIEGIKNAGLEEIEALGIPLEVAKKIKEKLCEE